VGVQEHAHAFDLALDLGRFNRTPAHEARQAGPSMGLGYAIDNGQTRLPLSANISETVTPLKFSVEGE